MNMCQVYVTVPWSVHRGSKNTSWSVVRGLDSEKCKRFVTFPEPPDRLWESTHPLIKWVTGIKRTEREDDHPPPNAEDKNEWNCTFTPSLRLRGVDRNTCYHCYFDVICFRLVWLCTLNFALCFEYESNLVSDVNEVTCTNNFRDYGFEENTWI